MDRFRLQTRPLRSFWGPSRLFQRRNFSFDPSSFTQNENPKLRWKGESRRFHPISVRLAKISVFESQTDRFFVLKWFIFALTKPRRPKYQPVTTETVHFLLSWESSRFWNDTLGPKILLLSYHRSPETSNLQFRALVKLGLEIFTFLSVYIFPTFHVPIFAAWWRRYIKFRRFRFEGSAVANRNTISDQRHSLPKAKKDGVFASKMEPYPFAVRRL